MKTSNFFYFFIHKLLSLISIAMAIKCLYTFHFVWNYIKKIYIAFALIYIIVT